MIIMRRHPFYSLVLSLCLSSASDLHAKPLNGLPSDREAQGDAFVTAWLALRQDLDSLFSLNVPPAQYRAWLAEMPDFLLRDSVRMATDHQLIVDIAALLAQRGGARNQALLRRLADRAGPIRQVLRMHRVRARDPEALSETMRALNHGNTSRRMEGAVILAGGGRREGFNYLRTAIKTDRWNRSLAARALGRYGGDAEGRFINKALGRTPSDMALRVARGELLMRKQFPYHHRELVARYPIGQGFSEEGIYETWLIVIERALSAGNGGSDRVFKTINELRRSPPPGRDPELVKRQMAALHDFWSAVDARIAADLRFPLPVTFSEAMHAVTRPRDRKEDMERFIGARVSAAIAIMAALGDRLRYPDLADPTPGFNAISPLGERALDGNPATSWPVKKGSKIVLEHPKPAVIDTLFVMLSCAEPKGRTSLRLNVEGTNRKRKQWKLRRTLDGGTRYFQSIDLNQESTNRLTITVTDIKGRLACVAEIRASTK